MSREAISGIRHRRLALTSPGPCLADRLIEAGWNPTSAAAWIMTAPQWWLTGARHDPALLRTTLEFMRARFSTEETLAYLCREIGLEDASAWRDAGHRIADIRAVAQAHYDFGLTRVSVPEHIFGWAAVGLDVESISLLTALGNQADPIYAADHSALTEVLEGSALLFGLTLAGEHGPVQTYCREVDGTERCGLRRAGR